MDKKEVDVFRDTPVRLLGYANEVGESFRALVPSRVVQLSYVIASGYVVADAADKAIKTKKILDHDGNTAKAAKLVATIVDTLLWQSLASVIIPGFTINRLCALSLYAFKKYTKVNKKAAKWYTVGIGLGCIPFIVKPIDNSVELLMNYTYRQYIPLTVSSNKQDS